VFGYREKYKLIKKKIKGNLQKEAKQTAAKEMR